MVDKKDFNMLFRARWTYIVIGIVFAFIGYSKGQISLSDPFFGAGIVVFAVGILLINLNKILNKKW